MHGALSTNSQLQRSTADCAGPLGMRFKATSTGLMITGLAPGSRAADSGLQLGDTVVSISGTCIPDCTDGRVPQIVGALLTAKPSTVAPAENLVFEVKRQTSRGAVKADA